MESGGPHCQDEESDQVTKGVTNGTCRLCVARFSSQYVILTTLDGANGSPSPEEAVFPRSGSWPRANLPIAPGAYYRQKYPATKASEGDFKKGEAEGSLAVLGLLGRIAEEWRRKGGKGLGGGANVSSRPNDGAGLGSGKGRDGVRLGGESEWPGTSRTRLMAWGH